MPVEVSTRRKTVADLISSITLPRSRGGSLSAGLGFDAVGLSSLLAVAPTATGVGFRCNVLTSGSAGSLVSQHAALVPRGQPAIYRGLAAEFRKSYCLDRQSERQANENA